MRRYGNIERPRDDGPVPPATKENWLAGGAHLIAAVLALLSFPIVQSMALFGVCYGGSLALGTWWVRPAARRGRSFRLVMLPLVLQAAVYVLYWYPVAAAALAGETDAAFLDSEAQMAAFQAALAALVLGWVPAAVLHRTARQAGLLVLAQVVGPGLAMVFYILTRLGV